MRSRKGRKLPQNPLCLDCFTEMVARQTADGLVCFEAKSGEPHNCGRYVNGQYRPAREARIYHKARVEALEDDPSQPEDTDSQKYGSDVLGALRGFQGRAGRG